MYPYKAANLMPPMPPVNVVMSAYLTAYDSLSA